MDFNTPIYRISDLSNNKLYIKREDLIPFSFGGNKARKAFNFFDEILKGDYDTIVTYGSSSSNHCRIISNLANKYNKDCYIVCPKEALKETFNSELMKRFGANFVVVAVDEVHDTIENLLEKLKNSGKKPYFIPGGGHGNIGTKSYVECYDEIRKYEKENNIFFDYIFLASGTGTTQAGLICGKLLNNDKKDIIGISIARKNPRGRNIVLDSVKDYLKSVNYDFNESDIEDSTKFIDDYTIQGYGKKNSEVDEVIMDVLKNDGIPLDSTYTGKAFYGMKQFILINRIMNKNILFIHTGGTPLFFDDMK